MANDGYHHGDLPAALLAAVDDLLAEEGVAATSLRAVARRAGVSHAAPAHHFGDRGGMLAAYAAQGFRAFRDALVAAVAALPPDAVCADALDAIGETYVDFGLTHRGWYSMMFRPEHVDDDHPDLAAASSAAFAAVCAVSRGLLAEEATDEQVLHLAITAWAGVHGFVSLAHEAPAPNGEPPELLDVLATLKQVLVAGMRQHELWVGDQRPASELPGDLTDPLGEANPVVDAGRITSG